MCGLRYAMGTRTKASFATGSFSLPFDSAMYIAGWVAEGGGRLAVLRPGDVVEALDCNLPSAVEPALLGCESSNAFHWNSLGTTAS